MHTTVKKLEKLSASERAAFEERAAMLQYGGPDSEQKKQAELELSDQIFRQILSERIIPGKCNACEKVETCILTLKQRALCKVTSHSGKKEDKNIDI